MNKISKIEFEGIKNINKKISFDLIAKKAENTKSEDLNSFHIKGIYGPNGTGKTALVEALTVYKMIVTNEDSLISNLQYINSLINNTGNSFTISMNTYLNNEDIAKKTYNFNHEIKIELKNQKLQIVFEKIHIDNKLVAEINNGEIELLAISDSIKSQMINTLKHSCVLARFKELLINSEENVVKDLVEDNSNTSKESFKNFILFFEHLDLCHKLNIFFEEKDDHKDYFIHKELTNLNTKMDGEIPNIERMITGLKKQVSHPQFTKKFMLEKSEINDVESELKPLTEFIKIFKPSLSNFVLDLRHQKDDYFETEILAVYGESKISLELESVGIKKLVDIYFMIQQLNNGEIVVFDEIDAHLHDVALTEILCYLEDNAKGQLIFTSHNLLTMDVLQEMKNTIDIISLSGEVTTWKRKGNAVARNLYKNGYISNDFDYGLFDLIGVFNV